jgi:hypothetical protein
MMLTGDPMPQFDAWLKTPDGITCCCGTTDGKFLQNRLWYAYMAGFKDGHDNGARSTGNTCWGK